MLTSSRSTDLPGCGISFIQQGLPARWAKRLRKLAFQLGYAGALALHLHAQVAILAKQISVFTSQRQTAGNERFA